VRGYCIVRDSVRTGRRLRPRGSGVWTLGGTYVPPDSFLLASARAGAPQVRIAPRR